jgi:hypothetical protein
MLGLPRRISVALLLQRSDTLGSIMAELWNAKTEFGGLVEVRYQEQNSFILT